MFDARRALTAAKQYHLLQARNRFPGRGSLRAGQLTWVTDVAPTPLSRDYRVRLKYQQGGTPEIYVDDPDLSLLADGDWLPHVYSQVPARLCLYLPGTREWTLADAFDETVLPWAVLWLYYFEDWLTGGMTEWRGGGEHPRARPPRSKPRSAGRR
ncbi:MAG: hypothetical protein CVT82_15195 [Alphaproteobacteria bacterium HGW-Alphaproteobacteria-4]|jgi:hypothetical protein|nr:MAG: hypothetical protein CVT82_15195 [Alphaproteobacteria bacterium HGW-Alphaproteobacteria-4]